MLGIAAAQPLWPSEMTALGTVAVAVAAVAIAAFAEWRASVRVDNERKRAEAALSKERAYAASVLADERELADTRLRQQIQAADERLKRELEAAHEQEELAEAYAVQVVVAGQPAGQPTGSVQRPISSTIQSMAVMVVNRGRYAITDIEAQLSGDGRGLISAQHEERIAGFDNLPLQLRQQYMKFGSLVAQGNVLGPAGTDIGMRFEMGLIPDHGMSWPGPYAVVRWRDRWAQRWEYKQGVVRHIGDEEPWRA